MQGVPRGGTAAVRLKPKEPEGPPPSKGSEVEDRRFFR